MSLPDKYKKQFKLVKEFENVWVCEDDFTRMLREILDRPDINGIDLHFYNIYAYLSKIDETYLYVIEDPEGRPFHDEMTFEAWAYYLDMLRLSLKCDTDLVDMARKRQKEVKNESN